MATTSSEILMLYMGVATHAMSGIYMYIHDIFPHAQSCLTKLAFPACMARVARGEFCGIMR